MNEDNVSQNKNANNKVDVVYRIWLSIKNDYRTSIGVDELSLVEDRATEGEEVDGE